MPLYVVKQGKDEAATERLVEANNQAAARNFVARETISVAVAGQKDLFRLAKAGLEVEVATDAPASEDGNGGEPPVPPQVEQEPPVEADDKSTKK